MASRHRLKTTAAVAPCTSRKSQVAPTVQPAEKESACAHLWTNPGCSWDGETSKLEKIFTSVLVQPHTGRPISLAPKGERASLYDPYLILSEHLPMTYDDGRGEA